MALFVATLTLAACEAEVPVVESQRVQFSFPLVRITRMDNVRQVLEGRAESRSDIVRVEVYEDSRLVGQAELDPDGTRWSIGWKPEAAATSLEVRAYDIRGQMGNARIDFQHVRFDENPLLYQTESLLSLPDVAGTQTRFTLDGSTPTSDSPLSSGPLVLLSREGQTAPLSLIPTNPLASPLEWRWMPPVQEVELATVVRIQRFVGTVPVGAGEARTFLLTRLPSTLPVVSLTTDAANFFDPFRGIYVPGKVHEDDPSWPWEWGTGNYMQDGKEWERPIHIEWFETTGQRVLAQNAGVRIHGAGSAALPQKSLRLYAKEDYGPETFKATFFPESPLHDFKRILLRTSGQDFITTKLKDCTLQAVLADVGLDLQACRPTAVYLNGEYWGLHELRERFDEYYLAQHHGLDRKKVVILTGEGELDVGSTGDEQPYVQLLNFLRENDLSVAENYAHVAELVDVDNFIDYTIAELFFGNEDWPQNNVKVWRYRVATPGGEPAMNDGRWRWLLYDLDYAFTSGPDSNSLARLMTDEELPDYSTLFIHKLLQSPEFQARFLARFQWHLEHTFTVERMTARLDMMAARIAPEMPAHIGRWGYPASVDAWSSQVDALRDALIRRPTVMSEILDDTFGPLMPEPTRARARARVGSRE